MKSEKVKLKPNEYESKWQKIWEEKGIYQPDLKSAKNPFYNLMMYPYPSAEGLHVGNMYAFTGADIFGRFQRMKGYDVFEPIGLDGFGIHSENYALKIGKHPKEQTKISEKNFYKQLHAIGNGYAFKNTLETYDPKYYKWTQWIFVTMFKHGLAYRRKSPINFCPSCKTVLSDEQVIDGRCERCKTVIEKRNMEQWFFRITDYAERLLQNTYKESFKWSEKVKIGQRNWIGKKEGIVIKYPVVNSDYQIECFTTRPDTNFGATFIVIAPEHPFVKKILSDHNTPEKLKAEIAKYAENAIKKNENERIAEGRKKTGVFTGYYSLNQLNDYKMPLFISDFVLMEFGTGAVVGVPGHDLRDFEFAMEFKLPVVRVVEGKDGDTGPITKPEQVQEEEGIMINSEFLNGKDIHTATKIIMNYLEEKGWGKRMTTYKLRDWCISRQRYWGAPIPMVYCHRCASEGKSWFTTEEASTITKDQISKIKVQKDIENYNLKIKNSIQEMKGWYPVPEKDLPVLLPDLTNWKPEGTGKGPLAKLPSFIRTKCPECGSEADRESDVCDTFLDSAWYFFRYPSTRAASSEQVPFDPEITKKWLPVDQYIGGAEHTVLHLLYSRFTTMVFHDLELIDFDEPYKNFYAHGLIIAEGAKMSKSRGNVVRPDDYINKYGADTLRAYLMFLGPFDLGGDFRDTGIAGMYRFLGRVWRLVGEFINSPISVSGLPKDYDKLDKIMHRTIKEVTEDLGKLRYNTALAHIMEFVNALTDNQKLITDAHIKNLLLILAPYAPHMTEELWFRIKNQEKRIKEEKESSIHLHPWPSYDPKYLVEDTVTIIVQVNGKLRESIRIKNQEARTKDKIEEIAKKSEKVKKYTEGKEIRKVIFVPGKLINFVV